MALWLICGAVEVPPTTPATTPAVGDEVGGGMEDPEIRPLLLPQASVRPAIRTVRKAEMRMLTPVWNSLGRVIEQEEFPDGVFDFKECAMRTFKDLRVFRGQSDPAEAVCRVILPRCCLDIRFAIQGNTRIRATPKPCLGPPSLRPAVTSALIPHFGVRGWNTSTVSSRAPGRP